MIQTVFFVDLSELSDIFYFFFKQRYENHPSDGVTRRYGAAFHAERETMVSGPTDVGHEETGTGGAVPD